MRGRYTRHLDGTPVATASCDIPADCYNCAIRAMGRCDHPDAPVWLDLPGLRSLKLVLQPEAWVVTDQALGHLPVMAWTDFTPDPDRGLHEPVPARLKLYRSQAERVMMSVRPVMLRQLGSYLAGDRQPDGPADVIRLFGQTD